MVLLLKGVSKGMLTSELSSVTITVVCLAVFNMYYKRRHTCHSAHVIHCKLWIRNSLPAHNLVFSYIDT